MEKQNHKYVTVAYELFADNEKGIHELFEKTPAEHPFQFITGMGLTLDAFEEKIAPLQSGETFDFTLSVEEAYGPYLEEHVIELPKETFCINGRFEKDTIYPGNVIPLVNADGNRFNGLVLEVKADTVVIDLNHPLSGKALHFRGNVVTSREATEAELQGVINMMSGEGCGCGECGGECGGCGGHGHEEEHHCEGHHHHGEGGCCGHGHGHDHEKGHHCEGHRHHGEDGCCGGHKH